MWGVLSSVPMPDSQGDRPESASACDGNADRRATPSLCDRRLCQPTTACQCGALCDGAVDSGGTTGQGDGNARVAAR